MLDDNLRKELEEKNTWQKPWFGPPLVSHWNHHSDSVDLYIFSNLEEIEVALNEKKMGPFKTSDFPGGVVSMRIAFEEGKLEAFASSGIENATHKLVTSGRPAKIQVEKIEYPEAEDYDGVLQFIISIQDEDGVLCPVNDIRIHADYDQSLVFLGADNGDMSDHQLFTEYTREVRNGKCLFVFKRKEKGKAYDLKFHAEGLEAADVSSAL